MKMTLLLMKTHMTTKQIKILCYTLLCCLIMLCFQCINVNAEEITTEPTISTAETNTEGTGTAETEETVKDTTEAENPSETTTESTTEQLTTIQEELLYIVTILVFFAIVVIFKLLLKFLGIFF